MSDVRKVSGIVLATAAAALFSAGCASTSGNMEQASSKEATIHCAGLNSCKGQTACKSASNNCKGQNSCKGQGWLPMLQKECDAK